MARLETKPPEAVYHLLLLGLMYGREDRPEVLARLGNSIFHAIKRAGALTEAERKRLAINQELLALVHRHCEYKRSTRRPPKSQVEQLIDTCTKELVVIVVPDEPPRSLKLLGPNGYELVLTNVGMERAMELEPHYEALLTLRAFQKGWKTYASQMRGIPRAKGTAAGPEAQLAVDPARRGS